MKEKPQAFVARMLALEGIHTKFYKTVENTFVPARHELPGTVVVAQSQKSGRGRRGKRFLSPKGGLYMCIVAQGSSADKATIASGVAVVEAVKHVLKIQASIKWVNDVFYQGKKICGILAERLFDADGKADRVVIGIGINTSRKPFPKTLSEAASLFDVIRNRGTSKEHLLIEVVLRVFDALRRPDIITHYRALCSIAGKRIRTSDGGTFLVKDILEDGSLFVQSASGEEQRIACGAVSILPDIPE